MQECKHCSKEIPEGWMETHILLEHKDKIDDSEKYEAEVSDGHLNPEVRAEKGEEFGYE